MYFLSSLSLSLPRLKRLSECKKKNKRERERERRKWKRRDYDGNIMKVMRDEDNGV